MAGASGIAKVANRLVLIGGLNWGLVGAGSFAKADLNVVKLIFSKIPAVENLVYLLVGLSALYMLWGKFKK